MLFRSGIEAADAILLIGTNPRLEASVLNARIRKRWRQGGLKVGVIGPKVDLAYAYDHIGAGADALAAVAEGRHAFAGVLQAAKRPMVIVGAGANILGNADVNLVAEKGFSPILVGNALSQSLLEAAFGSKDIDRNEKDNSSSAVTVDGLVKTGINKDQVLVINEQLNTPATISASDTLPYGITFDTNLTTPEIGRAHV